MGQKCSTGRLKKKEEKKMWPGVLKGCSAHLAPQPSVAIGAVGAKERPLTSLHNVGSLGILIWFYIL